MHLHFLAAFLLVVLLNGDDERQSAGVIRLDVQLSIVVAVGEEP